MKSKKAILIMIAGAICFASGVILHFETKNAWTYILYILGYILIILANKIEINKKIDSIDLNENTNSIMKKFLYKPLIITIIPIILIVCIVSIILPGFTKVTTICIDDYVISEDEQEMIIQISNISSAGYVRKVKTTQIEDLLYLDFYKCFGGINGSIGAKNEFEIPLNEDIEIFLLNTDKDTYKYVLEKDDSNNWIRSN